MNRIPLKWKSKCSRYTVIISASCVESMLTTARNAYPKEIGTSLIGFYSDDGFDAFICELAPLPPDSKGLRGLFIRGVKGMSAFFKRLRNQYDGKRYYVGEWHSHPNGLPYPSESLDSCTMSAISLDKRTNCPECILLIVGGDVFNSPQLGVYVYSRTKGRIDLYAYDL